MYIICYGKSPKALETGRKLIDEIGGRYVSGTELMTGSFVVSQGEVNCAVVMILPLEAAIKAMEETATDKTRGLPVIASRLWVRSVFRVLKARQGSRVTLQISSPGTEWPLTTKRSSQR